VCPLKLRTRGAWAAYLGAGHPQRTRGAWDVCLGAGHTPAHT